MKIPPPLFSALTLFCTTQILAANWPQYRGPNARGVDDSKPLATQWNIESGENIRWQTPIPGLAHASPIVWGDRVYIATAVSSAGKKADLKVGLYGDIDSANDNESHQWRLLALDKATGKILWNTLALEAVPKNARHTKATHCNSTPATDGERIAAIFASEGLFCFDRNGKLLWKKDLGPMVSGWSAMPSTRFGFSSSPIIHEGKVVVQCDVIKGSFLAVFDLADGREIWRTERTDVATWSTPTLFTAAGRTQIAINGWHHTGSYDFATGKEIWKLDGGGDVPVPTPIVANDLIYFTSAHGRYRPMRAIRTSATGDITPDDPGGTNAAIVFNHIKNGNYMQTPIIVGALLYGCMDNGLLTCFDAKTGTVRYSERISKLSEGFTSSPVSDGRHLYFTSELGNVYLVPTTDKFSVAATNALNETCLSTPAISDGALFFRTRDQVVSVGAKM